MPMNTAVEQDSNLQDLGPLAWVLDELRKSLDGATKAMRRFVRDAELARGENLSELDASQLRVARQQLHQAVGALEMVGMSAPAKVLRAMESLAQKFVERPELCSEDAAARLERASFALTEYLEGVIKGRTASPVGLFPQYRAVMELASADRVHPADLWPTPWRWQSIEMPLGASALAYATEVRARMDQSVLKLVKTADHDAAQRLSDVCIGLAVGHEPGQARAFWACAAGFFEAMGHGLLPEDVYTKRTASRILQQYASLAKGDPSVSERLAQDLVFFCALAEPSGESEARALTAVREAYGLQQSQAIDYEKAQYGRFDPAVLEQARKRIAAAAESWSVLTGGDSQRIRQVVEQFAAVAESMAKLDPDDKALAQALTEAMDVTARSAAVPPPALAMEVATSVLYLEAAYEDLDPTDTHRAERGERLAQRLRKVIAGAEPEPMENWMEDLYRRVSDRQTMGSVVDELRANLSAVEKSLDQFFRNPQDKLPLHEVPNQLAQMRGVFSVLGLDQPSIAALRMRSSVERLMVGPLDMDAARPVFEKLGNSLGAMGFLIDMLSYQRALAKQLFVFDEALGEFKPLMGRERTAPAVVAPVVAPPPVAVPAEVEDDDQELLDIFLEEAREVVQTGSQALQALADDPTNLADLTTLRRAFHTLKGSSRMVGCKDFGEAAWAFEQLLNSWLADHRPASADLLTLCKAATVALGRWVEDIAAKSDGQWSSSGFRKSADALRLDGTFVPLRGPGESPEPGPAQAAPADFASTQIFEVPELETPAAKGVEKSETLADLLDFDVEPAKPDFASTQIFEASDFELAQGETQVLTPEPQAQPLEISLDLDFPPVEATPAHAEGEPDEHTSADEQVKVIGSLRLGIPLYNVYLNEADEWSRRLQTELGEWALELHEPLPEAAVALAHSLAGTSATVGFTALSHLARTLEHALEHVQLHGQSRAEDAVVFNDAAEEVRRLLHQFAAGFLKEAQPALVDALLAITATEFVAPEEAPVVAQAEAKVELGLEVDALGRLDPDLFPIFDEEAAELLPALGTALRQWVARPDNLSARGEVLRLLHTLKGSARLAGAMRLGEMAHKLESDIEVLGTEDLTAPQLEPLLGRFDVLQAAMDGLRKQAQALLSPEASPATPVKGADAATTAPPTSESAPARSAASPPVRVKAQLLDRLVNQAGEMMMSRSRMESHLTQMQTSLQDLTGNLDRLRQQLRDVELQAETQMQSRLQQTKDVAQGFDPLEFDRFTRVQELTRMMAESVNDVATVQRNLQRSIQGAEDDLIAQGRQARDLQRDLLHTRMVEFDSILDRLHGVVRQAAKEADKQVRLEVVGGSIEMDRGILDRMTPAFEHMLRNSVVHGIESATARAARNKPESGVISITVQQEGNDVSVAFADDGGGLHLGKIRSKAIAQGLIGADADLRDDQAISLLFTPGFSTAEHVTELSGRGIGMDVVRSEVNALGGRIETVSHQGRGSTFTLILPLTTAVTQVVMLRAGEFSFGVPANLMEPARRVSLAVLEQADATGELDLDGHLIPFYWSGALLQVSGQSTELRDKTAQIAVFRSAGQRVALHVDEVLGHREVVVKHLGPQLARLPGLAGMSVLASGAIVLIYNPVALAAVYGAKLRAAQKDGSPAPIGMALGGRAGAANVPLVMVVDDSITVRRVTQRLLKREGYRVLLANDGQDALEKLQTEKPDLMLTDIEMPRMDGFDLVRTLRADARMKDLPIIMITSRIAEKHRDHAKSLGVDHYLGKPYSEDGLLSLVRAYCSESTAA